MLILAKRDILLLLIIVTSEVLAADKIISRRNIVPLSRYYKTENGVHLSYSSYAKERLAQSKEFASHASREHIYKVSRYSYRGRRSFTDRNGRVISKFHKAQYKKKDAYSEDAPSSLKSSTGYYSTSNNYYWYSSAKMIEAVSGDPTYSAISCDSACIKCEDKICKQCKPHTFFDSLRKECLLVTAVKDGALHFDNPTTPSSCENSYFLDAGVCKACPANCSKCSSGTVCLECEYKYLLTATNTCAANQCSVSGCEYCAKAATTCGQCLSSYGKIGDLCEPCNDPNCASCNDNQFKCNICSPGYYLTPEGVCSGCMEGCLECENKWQCKLCDGEYDFMMGNDLGCYYTEGSVLSGVAQNVALALIVATMFLVIW